MAQTIQRMVLYLRQIVRVKVIQSPVERCARFSLVGGNVSKLVQTLICILLGRQICLFNFLTIKPLVTMAGSVSSKGLC